MYIYIYIYIYSINIQSIGLYINLAYLVLQGPNKVETAIPVPFLCGE